MSCALVSHTHIHARTHIYLHTKCRHTTCCAFQYATQIVNHIIHTHIKPIIIIVILIIIVIVIVIRWFQYVID